jgi:transcriptional regulator with XRE-family HTH domain
MKMEQRTYRNWGQWLKRKRETKFRSAREFCTHIDLGISYPQYSRYESGDQLPSANQLVAICRAVETDPVEALMEWCLSQIEDQEIWVQFGQALPWVAALRRGETVCPKPSSEEKDESKNRPSDAELEARAREEARATTKAESELLGMTLVFGKVHRELFESDPRYRDVFTYVNAYDGAGVSMDDLSRDLGIETAHAFRMAETLARLGVLVVERGVGKTLYRASKKFFYFPDDEEFFDLRNKNFRHNIEGVLGGKKYAEFVKSGCMRDLLTRELTEEQYKKVRDAAEHWLVEASQMDEDPSAKTIYSIGLFMGPRFKKTAVEAK